MFVYKWKYDILVFGPTPVEFLCSFVPTWKFIDKFVHCGCSLALIFMKERIVTPSLGAKSWSVAIVCGVFLFYHNLSVDIF